MVFSVVDRNSFRHAEAHLKDLKSKRSKINDPVVILVANKQDIVRNRQVSEHGESQFFIIITFFSTDLSFNGFTEIFFMFSEGINLATKYGSKYIEVSAILNHRVDELLVGILRQIRLKPERGLDDGNTTCLSHVSNLGCLPRGAYDLMCNVFRKDDDATRSCENLLAL